MVRKSKIDFTTKVMAMEKILRGEKGICQTAKELEIDDSTVGFWYKLYLNRGPGALQTHFQNTVYPIELKLVAVEEYLAGKGSLAAIAAKYGLSSTKQLRSWLKEYNTHGALKPYGSGGGSYMRKARSTTLEERIAIVEDCLANHKNYGAMALKYNCSYQQVRNWVLRYEKMGPAGLEDLRGKRAATQTGRTLEEKQRNEIARLKQKIKDLEMENDILKKVRELEAKNRCL